MRRGWLDILSSIDGGDDMVETAAMLLDTTLDPWDAGDQGGVCLEKGRE